MSALLLARIDPLQLYPPFTERLMALVEEAEGLGVHYWAVSGFRSYAEQMRLWAQGRTQPGLKVTNAKGGESAHNFGIAADFCRDGVVDRRGLQPDWKPESYATLGQLAAKHGLAWGGDWALKDYPHVQLPGFVTREQLEPLRVAFETGGLTAVWEYLNKVSA